MVTRSPILLDEWLPAGRAVTMRAAGRWWDAVRVPRHIGEAVLTALGDDTGAVIEDPCGALLYWLIPPGSADGWAVPPRSGVMVQGDATYVAVPGPQRTAGPHWRVPPTPARCLTPPGPLRDLLRTAVVAVGTPR